MAQKPARSARKPARKKTPPPTLQQLIGRTETIVEKSTELLGILRSMDDQGFVIRVLTSGKGKGGNP